MREVAITGTGLVTAARVAPAGDHRDVLPVPGFAMASVDVRPLLKRRKDRKLLPRAAELAIAAAHAALGDHRPADCGLFLGVGREPSDGGDSERAIVASADGARFSGERFGREGLPLYPPLSSLRTLPNLVLAHVAIQLDLTGEGGTRAGTADAGLAAVVAGWCAVAEGRCDVALVGAADSQVDAASARDLVRGGLAGHPPGEAAAMLRLEPLDGAVERGVAVLAVLEGGATRARGGTPWTSPHEGTLGECGAAGAVVAMVLALGTSGRLEVTGRQGTAAWVGWRAPC